MTFSLLPDCLASRLSATLPQVESAVEQVERAGSPSAAARLMHPETEYIDHVQGAERRLRRWRRAVVGSLVTLAGLMPDKLAGQPATLQGWRAALGTEQALVTLREKAEIHLAGLSPPLGFGPRPILWKEAGSYVQHKMGPDPPSEAM
jgi:hypothetical protein